MIRYDARLNTAFLPGRRILISGKRSLGWEPDNPNMATSPLLPEMEVDEHQSARCLIYNEKKATRLDDIGKRLNMQAVGYDFLA
jgi:hypothetical protein